MFAVASYNAMPSKTHGISSEGIWRACWPVESHWKHRNVQEALGEGKVDLTAREWDDYLNAHAALTIGDYKQAVQASEERLRPVQESIQDQHARSVVLGGDKVLVRTSQCRFRVAMQNLRLTRTEPSKSLLWKALLRPSPSSGRLAPVQRY